MEVKSLYSTLGSMVFATAFAAVAYGSAKHLVQTIESGTPYNGKRKPKKSQLNPARTKLKLFHFHCRGYDMTAAAEGKGHRFKSAEIIANLKQTIRSLQHRQMPISPFLVVYYSKYSGDELTILKMKSLDTIRERNSWLDEEHSDGFMVEPEVEYPLQ